tara:strand:+ start:2565 stop:5042 length:2478 start_codon:yes stop_codon:yes gene_type:complete
MESRYNIIIIGAGIVGCSVAYHLAKKGVRNILVIEQDKFPEPGGSTSHASNFIFPIDHTEITSKLSDYGTKFYPQLIANGKPCYIQSGGIEVARSSARMLELKRKVGVGKSWGIPAEMISPNETYDLFPFINPKTIRGAMYSPTAGLVTRSVDAAQVMIEYVTETQAGHILPNTAVVDIDVVNGKVQGVETSAGYFACDSIVCTAGVWGPLIGEMAGCPIPLAPLVHQLVYTSPVKELSTYKERIEWPLLRDQDLSMYVRQENDFWEIGSYQHPALFTAPSDIPDPSEAQLSPTMRPFTPEHFEKPLADITELMPVLANAGFRFGFNGLLSVTPDGMQLAGPSSKVQGFWVAEAVWVKDGPGIGKIMAEWIVDGHPSIDTRLININRFTEHEVVSSHVLARASESFNKVYGIIHPREQWASSRNKRISPFRSQQAKLGGVFYETAGWERPQWYKANKALLSTYTVPDRKGWDKRWWDPIIGAEHQAVRHAAGLFDMTGFTKVDVRGSQALSFLEYLCVQKIDRPIGKIVYTALLSPNGGIEADLTITRLGEDHFRIITGAASGARDLAWFTSNLPDGGGVYLEDITSTYCAVGLWGPHARNILETVCSEDISNEAFPFGQAKSIVIGNIPALALRVSFVGELGWEIYTKTEFGSLLWDTLWHAGQSFGLTACGISGYLSSLRLEKGYRMWGTDLHTGFNPFQAGLLRDNSHPKPSRIKDTPFIGREPLLQAQENSQSSVLSCLLIQNTTTPIMGNEPILKNNILLGYVTSGDYGYTVAENIAYGYLPIEHATPGTRVNIQYLGTTLDAIVSEEPLFDPTMERLKS